MVSSPRTVDEIGSPELVWVSRKSAMIDTTIERIDDE
jgi:hypothetical protein